ncbi:MAG: putative addiction module antidote protein [Methylococcaceae bacterium]|nr:MAG: putative addiction module antidote protein [Methylococcaceae bacterium]
MAEIFTRYDSAEYLKTEADIAAYFEAALELAQAEDDPAFLLKAMGVIARTRNMTQLAKNSGISREGLYKALSGDGNPSFFTVMKLVRALGIKLHAEAA